MIHTVVEFYKRDELYRYRLHRRRYFWKQVNWCIEYRRHRSLSGRLYRFWRHFGAGVRFGHRSFPKRYYQRDSSARSERRQFNHLVEFGECEQLRCFRSWSIKCYQDRLTGSDDYFAVNLYHHLSDHWLSGYSTNYHKHRPALPRILEVRRAACSFCVMIIR